jgi:hypothetical protein
MQRSEMEYGVTCVQVDTGKLRRRTLNILPAFPITLNGIIDVQMTSWWPKPFASLPEEVLAGSQ